MTRTPSPFSSPQQGEGKGEGKFQMSLDRVYLEFGLPARSPAPEALRRAGAPAEAGACDLLLILIFLPLFQPDGAVLRIRSGVESFLCPH
jgi:hypothetical protein